MICTNNILRKCLIVPEFCSFNPSTSDFENFIVDELFPQCAPFPGSTDEAAEDTSDNDDVSESDSECDDVRVSMNDDIEWNQFYADC